MSDLENALKHNTGYTEETTQCKNCAFYEETEGVLDRSWISTCNVHRVKIISVSPHGRCNLYEDSQ